MEYFDLFMSLRNSVKIFDRLTYILPSVAHHLLMCKAKTLEKMLFFLSLMQLSCPALIDTNFVIGFAYIISYI